MQKETMIRRLFLLVVVALIIGPVINAVQPVNAKPRSVEEVEKVSNDQQKATRCAFATPASIAYLPLIVNPGTTSTPQPIQPMEKKLQYQVGKTYVYDYQMSNFSRFGTASKEEGIQTQTSSTTLAYGQARISITGIEGDTVFVGSIVLSNPVMCQKNPDGPDEFMDNADILADLATPVLFKQSTSGEIVDVQVADTVDPEAANYLKGVLNSLQATLSKDDAYAAEENGGQGVYTAQYISTLQDDGLHLEKTLTDDSFTQFYSQGDLSGVSIDNKIKMLLDRTQGVFSSVSFNEVTDVLTEDPNSLDLDKIEGVAIWGTSRSSGKLELTAVEETPANLIVRAAQLTYKSTGLGAPLDEIEKPTYGIDLNTLDLEAELDRYEAASTDDLDAYLRMRQIMKVDAYDPTSNKTLTAISERLMKSLAKEETANKLVDLLGNDGSATAQAALRRLIDPTDELFNRVSASTQSHVFANLSLLTDPQPDTYNLMTTIVSSRETTNEQKSMALLSWGSMGEALADTDRNMRDTIYNDLASRLSTATTPEETRLILMALGNTGHPNLSSLLTAYLPFSNPDVDKGVQAAAFWALRLAPGQAAEDLLIKAVDDDGGTVYPVPKDTAAMALKNRPGKPSDHVKDVLAGYHGDPPKPGGSFHWYWTKEIGGPRVGGALPGSVVIDASSDTGLNAKAMQEATFHLDISKFKYSKEGTLVSVSAWSEPANKNVQRFGYSASLFNKDFQNLEYNTPCANSDGDTIQKGHLDIFDATFEYRVWWILKVGVELTAVATYNLDYAYNWDVCKPTDLSADITVTGDAKLHVSAFGYAKIWPLRGGPKLEADVVHATVPGKLSGTYTTQDGFEACLHVPATLKAGDGTFYIYAERWKLSKFGWDTVYQYNDPDWNFTLWQGTFDIIPKFCFPK